MKRSTKGVPPYEPKPEHANRRFEATVIFWRKYYGSGRLINEFLANLNVDEVYLLTRAVNDGVDPVEIEGTWLDAVPPASS